MEEKVTTIKGFSGDLKCRDFQYEVGKTYEMDGDPELCEKGFHAIAEDACPLSVFDYYPPCDENGTPNRFCEVELSGKMDKSFEKIAASKIAVKAEIGIPGLVKAHIEWVRKHLKKEGQVRDTENCSSASNTGYQSSASNTGDYSSASNTGDRSSASNTGDYSSASNTGDYSSASNTGDQSSASNTGDRSSASNTGDYSSASNTGYQSSASNTGDRSSASNTGNQSSASNTGDRSSASNTGYQSSAKVSGKESVAIVTGQDSKASGALGCWLVLTERGDWNGETCPILGIQAVKVDGETIKPDTWYMLKNGKIIEAK